MAHGIRLTDDVRRNESDAEGVDRLLVHGDGVDVLCGVLFAQLGRDRRVIDEHEVDRSAPCVLEDCLCVHGRRIAIGLTGLGHHVADVDLEGAAFAQLLSDTADEEVRHDARIETAGAEDDRIRRADRLEGGGHRRDILREQAHAADASRHLGDA